MLFLPICVAMKSVDVYAYIYPLAATERTDSAVIDESNELDTEFVSVEKNSVSYGPL